MAKARPISEYELLAHFEAVRSLLAHRCGEQELNRPLAFWALPDDRRLPLAFMNKSLAELLTTPFAELFATPGVGRKKFRALLNLLARVAQNENGSEHGFLSVAPSPPSADGDLSASAANLSESSWTQWRAAIRRHGLGAEPLGRFATTLRNLPRVIWTTPLSAYLELSLAEIRALKTYGPKRVTGVLDVFASLRAILEGVETQPHLAVRIGCRFAHELEDWIDQKLVADEAPQYPEIRTSFVEPLVRQLELDADTQISQLAESRLALRETDTSVRRVAQNMELTRARVYQLTEAIRTILQVRWPNGAERLRALGERFVSMPPDPAGWKLFRTAADFFYPDSRVGRSTSELPNSSEETGPTIYHLSPD